MRRLALLVLLAGCAAPGASGAPALLAGVAEVDITPPLGTRMAGYFHERLNTGTKDPLKAKALVLAQGETRIAMVFCDLNAVPSSVSVPARERASRATGIPAANISVSATHSHTGPLYHGEMFRVLNQRLGAQPFDVSAMLTERIAESVAKANAALSPAALSAGSAEERGVSYIRRFLLKDGTVRTNPGALNAQIVKPMGEIDPEVSILLVEDGRRVTSTSANRVEDFHANLAALTVFPLHCDTVGGTEYSGDYPYFLGRELRARFGEGFVSLFGAGTCGNINHIDVSTKERRKAEEIGTTLARDILAKVPELRPVQADLAMRSVRVEVPVQRVSAEEVAAARKNVDKIGGKELPALEQVRICTILQLADLPDRWSLEVQAIRVGPDLAIVTLPGEIFVEHGRAIKKASPFKRTIVIELANENCAYVPHREAYSQGAYEVINSRLEGGGGEMLVQAALRLLHDLSSAKPSSKDN